MSTPVTTLSYITCNPTFDKDGNLLTAPVQGGFILTMTDDDNTYTSQKSVAWDGLDQKKSVDVDGITLTYDQVSRAAMAIANAELVGQTEAAKTAKAEAAAAAAAAQAIPA